MHRNLRPPEPQTRQHFPALITTPCQVCEATQPIHCRIIAFLLLIHYFTLWPGSLPFDLEHLQRIACDVGLLKLCIKFERNRAIRGWVIAISVFDLIEHCVTCCARLWDNFHPVWPSTTYVCLNYSFFCTDMLCHAVTVTFDPLILKVRGTANVTWSKSVPNLSKIEQSLADLLIIWRIFARVMSRCVTLWPLDLEL